jgi:hypothetical protein
MATTRRWFLGSAAAAAWSLGRPWWAAGPDPRCVVLDLQRHCSLRESVAGYRSALDDARDVPRSVALIVPAALAIPLAAVRTIMRCLQAGGTVVLESGAGFAAESDYHVHRAVLRDRLQLHIEAPVGLWPRQIPYVDYSWPYPAQLRDFSRVVPLGHQPGEIIAWVDGLPVALKRPMAGRGTLIFLGSPLGPALWAGDAEARRWLCAAIRQRSGNGIP